MQALVSNGIKVLGWVSPKAASEVALKLFTTPRKHARPEWEDGLLKKAERVQLISGLVTWQWGDRKKPAVLLVHGWAGRGSQLAMLAEPLVRLGYRVIALDGPAHGESIGTQTNFNQFANALVDAVDEIGDVEMIVAHSFGAGATSLAVSRGLDVKKFVLVAAPAESQWIVDGFCRRFGMNARVREAFQKRLEDWAGIPVSDLDVARFGAEISKPALVIHDPADKVVPFSNAEKIAQAMPQSRLIKVTGAGHRRILRSQAFIDAVTSFASA